MTKDIREQFEKARDPEMMTRYKWNEDDQEYEPVGDGKHWKARQLTDILPIFAEGYQSRQPEIDELKARIAELEASGLT